ncbi:MAG: M48 family metallopeptidase [Paracoccaceae bacterium]
MIKFTPILLAILYALVMYRFSVWKTLKDLDRQSSELADPALQPVFTKMAKALDIPRIRVHLYEIEPINGLAAPDGRIFITRGFYNKFRDGAFTDEEIASVIAHELGHVALGHSRRRMIDFSGQNAIRVTLSMVLGRIIPGVGPWLAGLLTTLLAARLSRSDEYEADEYAAALLTKAGIGIEPQKSMFSKLSAHTAGNSTPPAWLLSHPKTQDRIQAIDAHSKRWTT